jgi:hypothetical protein
VVIIPERRSNGKIMLNTLGFARTKIDIVFRSASSNATIVRKVGMDLSTENYYIGCNVFIFDYETTLNSFMNSNVLSNGCANPPVGNLEINFIATGILAGRLAHDYNHITAIKGTNNRFASVTKVIVFEMRRWLVDGVIPLQGLAEMKIALEKSSTGQTTYNEQDCFTAHRETDYHLFPKSEIHRKNTNTRGTMATKITQYLEKPKQLADNGVYKLLDGTEFGPGLRGVYTTPTVFDHNSEVYSSRLDSLSAEVSMKAYDDYLRIRRIPEPANGVSNEPYHLKKMLEDLGFYNIRAYNYYDDNEHNNSFVLARRQVGGHNVVAVIIRGTDSAEWKGNFKVWDDNHRDPGHGTHYSFYESMKSVDTALRLYVLSSPASKIWITGHSRGGAVANLLAAKLTQQAMSGSVNALVTKENIYAYTYATPNVKIPGISGPMGSNLPAESEQQMKANYMNIFNVVIDEDFVTHVPMSCPRCERQRNRMSQTSRSTV